VKQKMGWLPRLSFFAGLGVYLVMAGQGRDPLTALERALLASVILYGLGVFYLLAFWHLARHRKKSVAGTTGTGPARGMDGASSGAETGPSGTAS